MTAVGFRNLRDRGRSAGAETLHLLEGIRRGLQMAPREVQVHRRVRQVRVAEQQLNRPQVGAGFEEVGRVSSVAACEA